MKLHDLVKLKHLLKDSIYVDDIVNNLTNLQQRIQSVNDQMPEMDGVYSDFTNELITHYDTVLEQAQTPIQDLQKQLAEIDTRIANLTHKIFANNYELEMYYGSVESIRVNRKINCSQDIEEIAKQRILLHTSWRYPALEIGCRDGEWTQYLIASDPLYIMDRQKEFLDSANSRFPTGYQNRLRKYQLIDNSLAPLPKNQFSFAFSWGYFNFISLDTMTQFLKEMYQALRPGGVFMFTYNDGDTPSGASLAESFAQSYLPKSLLIPTCQSSGFEIYAEHDYTPGVSWLEIRKPGKLSTIKAHQVLGEIKPRNP
jgi:SAM-dependent methyltransferase